MEKLLSIDPGLMIWSIVNFLIFLFLLIKFAYKPIAKAISNREKSIDDSIKNAEEANKRANELVAETEQKLADATKQMNQLIEQGKQAANEIIQKAKEEAEKIRQEKIAQSMKDIEMAQEKAFKELKKEIGTIVVQATEKILEEKLNPEKDYQLIEGYIQKLSKN
ncbi:MAG TPA: F0F1 ATP synthase subunit B [Bacteroidota bacterium]|nr:F0F1 ATP synthase subunit B [Bacteroidota bacterium]HRT68439.1 F0F1 ATP synthase subunit B [Bacteroidota bacterium]